MGYLHVLLTATLSEALTHTESKSLDAAQLKKLGNAAAHLWTKIQRPKNPSVLQNHIALLQEVMQATSEQVCWNNILDELLTNETLTETARRREAKHLTELVDNASMELETAMQRARTYAVLQNQRRPNTAVDQWLQNSKNSNGYWKRRR